MDIASIWASLQSLFSKIINKIILLLPTSPFDKIMELVGDIPFLGYLNWFFPIGTFITILEIWLVSVGLFYLYMVVLRWVKAID